jgi:hypothetical protein
MKTSPFEATSSSLEGLRDCVASTHSMVRRRDACVLHAVAVVSGILTLLVCVDIVFRRFGIASMPWLVEVIEYVMYGGTFLAAPWILSRASMSAWISPHVGPQSSCRSSRTARRRPRFDVSSSCSISVLRQSLMPIAPTSSSTRSGRSRLDLLLPIGRMCDARGGIHPANIPRSGTVEEPKFSSNSRR